MGHYLACEVIESLTLGLEWFLVVSVVPIAVITSCENLNLLRSNIMAGTLILRRRSATCRVDTLRAASFSLEAIVTVTTVPTYFNLGLLCSSSSCLFLHHLK